MAKAGKKKMVTKRAGKTDKKKPATKKRIKPVRKTSPKIKSRPKFKPSKKARVAPKAKKKFIPTKKTGVKKPSPIFQKPRLEAPSLQIVNQPAIQPVIQPTIQPIAEAPATMRKEAPSTVAIRAPSPNIPAPTPKSIPSKPGRIIPDLNLLPAWEDKSRLNEAIAEEGFEFALLEPNSQGYKTALKFISEKKKIPGPGKPSTGEMLVDCHDKDGNLAASMLFYSLPDDITYIAGSRILCQDRKRELHLLIYAAALGCARAKNIVYASEKKDVSEDMAGRFILLGRGYGMSAMPVNHPSMLFFLRRIGREYDFLISGPEISKIMEGLRVFFGSSLDPIIGNMNKTIAAALVQLPLSPDAGEHLHEIQDAAAALSIPAEEIEPMIEVLRTDYIQHRKDIIPEYL
jgi:hypothetical protein